jgi:malonate decarboxylase delta subunit
MEHLNFEMDGLREPRTFDAFVVGVVGSGNLEVMLECSANPQRCSIHITTSARGFGPVWEAVVNDFQRRHALGGVNISINDMGATPAVVSLRLDQAVANLTLLDRGGL